MCDSTVMLSEAKHLSAHRDRPFAALRACVWITHIVAPGGSAHRSPPRAVFRPLVAAPASDAWLRCTGPDQVTMWVIHTQALSAAKGLSRWAARCFAALSMTVVPCHPERSEGSVWMGLEMLRCPRFIVHPAVGVVAGMAFIFSEPARRWKSKQRREG